ncbi:MAG: tail fiber domain-containing protein [Bacteroidales bacterium]|nr:tail fiber domain-containing protein [Bacteroidales bacterium]
MKKYLNSAVIFVLTSLLMSETLFEVKDASNNPVLNVSTDGLRIMNEGDTLMVISSEEIRANIGVTGKGLSRAFSVTTTQSKGSGSDLMRLTSDSTRFWISDTGSGFGVSSQIPVGKSIATDFLKVSNVNTQMREGTSGERYTDFSPENIFLGLNSGLATEPTITNGIDNVFIGNNAGLNNISGYQNTYLGVNAGRDNQTQFGNVFVGSYAGEEKTTGGNTIIGMQAGRYGDTGGSNTFVGYTCGRSTTGGGNTFVGMSSGTGAGSGIDNAYFGHLAGAITPGGNYNVYIGKYAGYGSSPNSGSDNVYVGQRAGISATGSSNVFLGSVSGAFNTGSGNIFLGHRSGENETGSNLLFIDNSNTAAPLIYGDFTADSVKINGVFSVSEKTYLNMLDVSNTLSVNGETTLNNTLNVASDATFYGNKVSLIHPNGTSEGLFFQNTYNANTDSWHLYQSVTDAFQLYYNTDLRGSWDFTTGVYSSLSDRRAKKNVEDMTGVIDRIMKLSPKRYNFTSQKENEQKYIGLIAQEVKELFPEFVFYHEESDSFTMDYAGMSVVAIQAIKEQQSEIDDLRKEIMVLKELIKK